jgi:hypothetical protein
VKKSTREPITSSSEELVEKLQYAFDVSVLTLEAIVRRIIEYCWERLHDLHAMVEELQQ